jgi:hypothetical protein
MTSRGIQLPLAICGEAVFDSMADGSLIVRNARDLGPYPNHLTERLQVWAAAAPASAFLAERSGNGWRNVTYREAWTPCARLGRPCSTRASRPAGRY